MRKVIGQYNNIFLVDEGEDRGRIVDVKFRIVCPVGRLRQMTKYYPWSPVSEAEHVIRLIESKIDEKDGSRMKMKMSEVIDRWTILRMQARFNDNAKRELSMFDHEIHDQIEKDIKGASAMGGQAGIPRMSSAMFLGAMLDLMEANAKIWENESAIRNANENDPANSFGHPSGGNCPEGSKQEPSDWLLKEIGRRTLLIRDYNKQRIKAKQTIDTLFGEIQGVKVDHQSNPKNIGGFLCNQEDATLDVVLVRVPDTTRKIACIKVVREMTALGLREAKDLVDKVPSIIKAGVPREEAEEMKYKLEKEGGWVELRSK